MSHYAGALYLLTSARRMARLGVGCASIDPTATVAELEREYAGGALAPSWTPPWRADFLASLGAPDDAEASPSPGHDASSSAAHDAQGRLPW